MAYDEDVRTLAKLEKVRMMAMILAIGMLFVSIAFDLDVLDYPRAAAWATAGIVSILEARVLKRMGRDPDISYLWAVLYFLVAGLTLW
ncbi:MAG: hypothetical protein AB7S26_38360 [Sandaracinaceae bacterium]